MEAPELHRLHGELLEAGALHGGVVVPVGLRRGGRMDGNLSISPCMHAEYSGTC